MTNIYYLKWQKQEAMQAVIKLKPFALIGQSNRLKALFLFNNKLIIKFSSHWPCVYPGLSQNCVAGGLG